MNITKPEIIPSTLPLKFGVSHTTLAVGSSGLLQRKKVAAASVITGNELALLNHGFNLLWGEHAAYEQTNSCFFVVCQHIHKATQQVLDTTMIWPAASSAGKVRHQYLANRRDPLEAGIRSNLWTIITVS